ncbi:MAG: hypothetical protein ABI972_04960 [Acidobacteriota bacterium]
MRFLVLILRVFSYGYHTLLGLFLLGIGLVAKFSASHTAFSTPALPGEGDEQIMYAIALGAIALGSVAVAIFAKFRPLFILWTLAAVILFVRGFFWEPYNYSDAEEFKFTLYVLAGAVVAFLGSLPSLDKKR